MKFTRTFKTCTGGCSRTGFDDDVVLVALVNAVTDKHINKLGVKEAPDCAAGQRARTHGQSQQFSASKSGELILFLNNKIACIRASISADVNPDDLSKACKKMLPRENSPLLH